MIPARFLVLLACFSALTLPAQAVVPGLMGPLQAVVALIPQVFALLLGLLGSAATLSYWRNKLWLQRRWLGGFAAILVALLLIWAFLTHPRESQAGDPSAVPVLNSWTTFRGSNGGMGCIDGKALPIPAKVLWSYSESQSSQFLSSPIALDHKVYIASANIQTLSADGSIDCLDATDGHLLWRRGTAKAVFSSPVIAAGRLYCGEGFHEDKDCKLYCLNATTGEILFTVPCGSHIEGAPALEAGKVVFSAGDEGVMCADALSGKVLWHQACGHCDSSPIIAGGRVFIGTAYGANSVMALDLNSGAVLWSKKMDLPAWGNPAVLGNKVCFGLGNGTFNSSDPHHPRGAAICFDCASGQQLWRTEVGDSVNDALVMDGDQVILGCRDGVVACLNLADGSSRWKALCGKPVLASPVVQKDSLIVAGGDGYIRLLKRADGDVSWLLPMGAVEFESSPVLSEGRLFVGAGSQVVCIGQ